MAATPTSDERESGDPNAERLDRPDPAQQFGKAAAEDAELADRLTEEADGDLGRAESAFDEKSRGPVPTETAPTRDSE